MRRLRVGTLGSAADEFSAIPWRRSTPRGWESVVLAVTGGNEPREVQARSLVEACLLTSRRNLIVSSPTNSGKSAVARLAMLQAVARGKRAVLVEPLKALARQQKAALESLVGSLPVDLFSTPPNVVLATGDYRLDHDDYAAPPPSEGELVVATPERLDSILRNPDSAPWVDSIGVLVVDEAHLINEKRRGPTLERVIATCLAASAPPRILLMSATLGDPERLVEWLRPADAVQVSRRTPPLVVEFLDLEGDDERDDVLSDELALCLTGEKTAALVFAYTRRDTESLAKSLSRSLGPAVRVEALHSGLPIALRAEVQARVEDGTTRCVVATTSLEMGLNLPVTHVVVRDATFRGPGGGPLSAGRLLQMLGRAGRGDTSGIGTVILGPSDRHDRSTLVSDVRDGVVDPICSAFERPVRGRAGDDEGRVLQAAEFVIGELLRAGDDGRSDHDIADLARHTLAGEALGARIGPAVSWLVHPCRVLAYRGDDGRLRATVLGSRAGRGYLPLPHAAGFGRLVRDLLTMRARGQDLLARWRPMDHLLLTQLVGISERSLRPFGEALADSIDGWMERNVDRRPVLFDWIEGDAQHSKASQLLGSLGLTEQGPTWPAKARKLAYRAVYASILLAERGRGASAVDLQRRWRAKAFIGEEERMRETAIWLTLGQGRLCDIRAFYHHILASSGASPEHVKDVKKQLKRMRAQAFELIEELKYCSPLGPMVVGIRRMYRHHKGAVVGEGTLRRLEGAGLGSLAEVARMSREDLVALGVRKDFARQIVQYCRRLTR